MTRVDKAPRRGFAARFAIVAGVCLAMFDGAPAAAQSAIDFTVSGTSTIRGWTCSVSGTAEVASGSGAPAPGFASGVQGVTLTVPVADFECPNEEMTEHLMEAMRPGEFAEITFRMESYEVTRQGAQATGALTILDTTESVTVPIELTPSGAGVEIEGDLRLDMTAFGVVPPEVMLGMLKVRPQIRIEFSGVVTQ